ncbi:MAG TPA: 50S ribosomal protein L13 [Acidobacteriota bacterium]|jgi:large subunit ribosomal protein L13|nr:50S ribosomal protein L13 [Acidobacteriota bacterium]
MKTYLPRVDDLRKERHWYVVDAEGVVLGRLASRVAALLMGKDRTCYTPFFDTGAFVIVVNASKVRLTGRKLDQKIYHRHSGIPGGLKAVSARDLLARFPERVIEEAITGMLPKNKLGKTMARKLKVYRDSQHPHQAQKPVPLQA